MIRVLTWAGLLLVVLYSPFGSPDLYSPKTYYNVEQSVNFSNVEVSNTPKIKIDRGSSGSQSYQETTISEINPDNKRNSLITSSSSRPTENYPTYTNLSFNISKSLANNSGFAVNGSEVNNSKNSTNSSTQNQMPLSLSSDLAISNQNTMTRQSSNSGSPGITDPGADPTGNPIPVGDGWAFLTILASGYALWRMKTLKR